uniref:Splicing regulatory glutamine/lysine-rich protein 1-like n=1 Tax=Phallusia mammillata TaxID=59560 RepID=A0A6F9DU71_9ASCI|nr:splicing regulatory glutamine/lysine-rich protein 1-like [Phallusia mammillata]
MATSVIQVTNVAPTSTQEQMETLFGFLGPIAEIKVYPTIMNSSVKTTKVVYVRYSDYSCVGAAQHLSNTVFIDRALMCIPYKEGIVPDEATAMQYLFPATSASHIPGMSAGNEPAKIEDMRKTIYVGNLDSQVVNSEQLTSFFSTCGTVKNVRLGGDETQPIRFAFVEFTSLESAQSAMQLNGMNFCERPLLINALNSAIVKPPPGSKPPADATAREIDEAMRRVREAQTLITKALEGDSKSGKKRSRSRSRSRDRHRRRRSRSRDRSRRRRSRSRSHGRSRRSRSRSHRSRRRSRSRSRDRRRKRTRSRSPRKKSGSRSPSKKSSKSHRKDRKRDRDRDRDRDHKRSKHKDEKKTAGENGTEADEKASEAAEKNGAPAPPAPEPVET